MNNKISIHPITKGLLDGSISLSTVTLNQFRKDRIIYPTMKAAKKKGFEAHHIVPRSLQKDSDTFDDRCIRYTSFEHIVDHFLMAKEDKKYLHIFECMTLFNFKNLMNDEKEILNKCIEYASLRKEGIKKISEAGLGNKNALGHKLSKEAIEKIRQANIDKYGPNTGKPMPENVKEILKKVNTGNSYHLGYKHSEEAKKIMSEKAKLRPRKPCSEETKKKLSESHKGKTPWNK